MTPPGLRDIAFKGSRMRTLRQLCAISSTRMRIGTKGGYNSSRRASDRIRLRVMKLMNRCINAIGTPCLDLFLRSRHRERSFAPMRTMHQWLDEYGASHRNPSNELLHWICVPAIVMTVLGFLWAIPVPQVFGTVSPWLNWATIAVIAWVSYYFLLSPSLGAGAAICLVVLLFVVRWLD